MKIPSIPNYNPIVRSCVILPFTLPLQCMAANFNDSSLSSFFFKKNIYFYDILCRPSPFQVLLKGIQILLSLAFSDALWKRWDKLIILGGSAVPERKWQFWNLRKINSNQKVSGCQDIKVLTILREQKQWGRVPYRFSLHC